MFRRKAHALLLHRPLGWVVVLNLSIQDMNHHVSVLILMMHVLLRFRSASVLLPTGKI